MSEEEKEAIEYLKKHIIPCSNKNGNIEFLLNEVILNLIDKLQKENEELKEDREKYKIRLTDEQYNKVINSCIEDINNKLRNKIKNKIKELEEDKKGYKEEGFENMKFATEITIIALEELLGEE